MAGAGRRMKQAAHLQGLPLVPDDRLNPRVDTYDVDLATCGPMVLDALIRSEQRSTRRDLPPLLPRGHLRFVRDEHRQHQHAGLHKAIDDCGRATAAVPICPLCRTCRWSRTSFPT